MHEQIDAIMRHAEEHSNFSGVCLLTRGNDILYHRAFGLAHRGFAIPNRTSTRFDIASITKLFTAVAVMQLIERAAFGLETAVMPYLGRSGTKISDAVTVFHLLTHTSGIADDADEEAGESYEALFVDKPNYAIRETIAFLPQCIEKDPVFAPGEGVRYNNCAFILLGLMVEKASGQPYRDYVRDNVFAPAGMTGADFCAMDEVNHDLAEHYKAVTRDDGTVMWKKNIYSYPPIGSPDGGATVTALDLDAFLRATVGGRLLGEDATALLRRPHVLVDDGDDYRLMNGFAFEYRVAPDDRIISIEKEGENAGVASQLFHYPKHDTTLVLLANQDCNVQKIVRDIERLILET